MATYNIIVINNDTYTGVNFTITVNDSALDLTSATIKMQVRQRRDLPAIITLETGNGITILSAITGNFKIDSQIISGDPGIYKYDIEITLADGRVKTYISGNFTILEDITHA